MTSSGPPPTAISAPSATPSPMSTPLHVPSRAVVGAIESAVVREQCGLRLPTTVPTTSSDETSDDQDPKDATLAVTKAAMHCSNDNVKKRKSTYYMRKDEMSQLQTEIVVLQETLSMGQHESMCPEKALIESLKSNAALHNHVRQGDLSVASAQSLIASYSHQSCRPPLGGFIHLPVDPIERQRILCALKMVRIQEAIQYALARSQFLDLLKMTRQTETFETDAGDFVTTHWEITPLEDARSVRHAFQALQYFTDTQEMSMSEKFGVLTLRESESDPVDGTQALRMLSKHENGLQSEANVAIFSQYFDASDMLNQPHALLVTDFIDQDDLYPRQPRTRIQKDVVSVILLTQVPDPRRSDRPVVTMLQGAFVRVNTNPFWQRRDLEYLAREGVGTWCEVMLKCMRERLAWQS